MVLVALLILSGIIFVHELGHFIAARAVGIPITEFSVGMGKEVLGVTRGRTRYRLNWVPLGGYVSMGSIDGKPAIESKPYWAKALFISGGVLMNLLLAVAILTAIFMAGGRVAVTDGQALVAVYIEPRPALEALEAGIRTTALTSWHMLSSIPNAIAGLFTAPEASGLSGPVGIVQVTQQTSTNGLLSALYLTALLSIAIGVFNILPILPLDGGHLLMHTVELFMRRPVPARVMAILSYSGLALVLALMVAVTILDLKRLF